MTAHEDGDLVRIGRPRFSWSWALHGSYLISSLLLGSFMAVLMSLPHEPATFLDARAIAPHLRFQFDFGATRAPEQAKSPGWLERRGAEQGLLGSYRQRGDLRASFGRDPAPAGTTLGSLLGGEIGEVYGFGGLGQVGTGRGEGSIGLGNFGTIGKSGGSGSGSGYSAGGRAHAARASRGHAQLGTPQLAVPVLERPAALPSMDPNGRFATTYRPGHGRLSWLDAALARGNLPAVPDVLVGDLAAGAAPRLRAPRERALSSEISFERRALPPSGGPVHMRIVLRSADLAARRAPLGVHVALDVSGSMSGTALANAVAAVQQLVSRLHDGDRFSLTTFSGSSRLVVPAGLVGPRRASIRRLVEDIRSESSTNIGAGLASAFAQARRDADDPGRISLVLLLSDGQPNAGETRPEALAMGTLAAFQGGIQTSAFGLGESYDDRLMSAIADAGAGGYYYLRSSEAIAGALEAELEQRLQPVAQAVELRVRLARDVRLVRTYGARRLDELETAVVRTQEVAVDRQVAGRDRIARDRQHDSAGGMRFFIPAFARSDQHVLLLGLELPPGAAERTVATVELKYKDRIWGRNTTGEQLVKLRHADSDVASFATIDPSVQQTVQVFAAGQALVDAADAVRTGDVRRASALLAERVAIMHAAGGALARTPTMMTIERQAVRLERFRELLDGRPRGLAEPLTLALLLGNTGRELLR